MHKIILLFIYLYDDKNNKIISIKNKRKCKQNNKEGKR